MPETTFLSRKPIPSRERLILALDVPSPAEARQWVERLGDSVQFYKLGLELFLAGGYFELIDHLRCLGKKVFVDLKLFDVPETVKSAVAQLTHRDVTFVTVHGNDQMLSAAVEAKKTLNILAVTALTSLDRNDLQDLGFACDVEALVLSRAKRALQLGCDGVVSSGLEAAKLREHLGEQFLVVTPGIRPVDNIALPDDQKRIAGVEEAFFNGADYIVLGRPIRRAPDPRAKAEEIQRSISKLFAGQGEGSHQGQTEKEKELTAKNAENTKKETL